MDNRPVTNNAIGEPESTKEKILGTGAAMIQNFDPVSQICAHLHAFHAYADDPKRDPAPSHHYCGHVNEDVRQCLLFDSGEKNARLIGIEYMVKPHIYEQLQPEERKMWHSHVFEVKSGMLYMPAPRGTPLAVWETAETKEMEEVITLYGKVFQLWQPGDLLPLGKPKLMTSYTARDQFDFDRVVGERDREHGIDSASKAKGREYIEEPSIHPDADATWKTT